MTFRAPQHWACGAAAIAVVGTASAVMLGRAAPGDLQYAAAYLTHAALVDAAFVWFFGFYAVVPRLLRRAYSPMLAAPHFWLTAVGALMTLAPGIGAALDGPAIRYDNEALGQAVIWGRVGTGGYLTAALGTVAFLVVVIDMARQAPQRARQ